MLYTAIKCDQCGKEYKKRTKYVKYNNKKGIKNICSDECMSIKNSYTEKIIFNCHNCGKSVTRTKAKIKDNVNSFCSRSCSISYHNRTNRHGKNHPNYLNGESSYRSIALYSLEPICNKCGYNVLKILEVHHIDGNRKNNSIENLEVLCPTHHKEKTLNIMES